MIHPAYAVLAGGRRPAVRERAPDRRHLELLGCAGELRDEARHRDHVDRELGGEPVRVPQMEKPVPERRHHVELSVQDGDAWEVERRVDLERSSMQSRGAAERLHRVPREVHPAVFLAHCIHTVVRYTLPVANFVGIVKETCPMYRMESHSGT